MSSTPPDQPDQPETAETPAAGGQIDPGSTAALPIAPPPPPAPTPPPAGTYPSAGSYPPAGGYPPPGQYAFAPLPPKPPREPWINPRKRTTVTIVAVVAVLVLLFVGGVIGHVVTDHRQGRFGNAEFVRPNVAPGLRNPGQGYNRQLPNLPRRNGPNSAPTKSAPTNSASAHPSATATS